MVTEKSARLYTFFNSATTRLFLTNATVAVILAVTFSVLVFENQLDLIAENALMRSLRTGLELRERIERMSATGPGWTDELESILPELNQLDINRLTVFSGSGSILFSYNREPELDQETASLDELRLIHRAITSRDFQSRLFTHTMSPKDREIDLFIPFLYSVTETGVIASELRVASVDVAVRHLYNQAILMAVLVLALHGGVILASHRLLVMPLRRLVDATRVLAEGGHDLQLPVARTSELVVLTDAFREMSHSVWQMQDSARSANPLSGLPGNVEIEKHVRQRMSTGEYFSVLYCDLDSFKAYNDKYGFNRGDQVILFTRDCLLRTADDVAPDECFVGHQGGDDFVVACRYQDWESFAAGFVARFDNGIRDFYDSVDQERGFILAKDRQGRDRRFPLMSVSVAAVTNRHRDFENFGEIVKVVAEMKALVKSRSGSQYAIDRRTE